MACPLATERVWVEKSKYHDAEKDYFEHLSKLLKGTAIKGNIANGEPNSTSTVSESVNQKTKKNRKLKASSLQSEMGAGGASIDGVADEKNHSETSLSIDAKTNDPGKKDNSKNEEAKAKKKKKKKNNKENSEKSQECPRNDSQEHDKEEHLKRQKSNPKLKMDGIAALAASPITAGSDVLERVSALEKENANLRELVESLKKCCTDTQKRVQTLETRLQSLTISQPQSSQKASPQAKKEEKSKNESENDDGVDLFASDSEEDEEANAIREQRLAEYQAKKSKKPALIAKSSVVLDIKPWDDETDLKKMEEEIRKIETDGLLWGASKLQPVAFGIKKLVLSCVVEDEKVSIDWLTEEIEKLDEYVQSVDVAAFNKI